ncbi:unnamed protein product [Symbiodinium natans]|uniref:Peptidase A1 domain-containing protein n=1 Tax=Symbiodinium natans TaxID=878477 RepID=A0A812R0X9_9DINO|nr:unnamed protein product [Symbiodinium natans]
MSKNCHRKCEHGPASWPQLHSFSTGLQGSPDLKAAKEVASFLGTVHHEYVFTVEEALDALPDVIYHLETFDVTTVRASTPMYLMARRIRASGVKMVLSGEGADEIFGGYLYFHKAPNAAEFHAENCRKIEQLHLYDCLRANKAMMAWGVEARVPFLDRKFMEVAMGFNPVQKMCRDEAGNPRTEKWILRKAFDLPSERSYLPQEVLWRQKEQFSDGVGYSWIDSIKAHAEKVVSDQQMSTAPHRFPVKTPRTKEAYMFRQFFAKHFGENSAAAGCVGWQDSIACSSEVALKWDKAFQGRADASGRAVAGVHVQAYDKSYQTASQSPAPKKPVKAQAHRLKEEVVTVLRGLAALKEQVKNADDLTGEPETEKMRVEIDEVLKRQTEILEDMVKSTESFPRRWAQFELNTSQRMMKREAEPGIQDTFNDAQEMLRLESLKAWVTAMPGSPCSFPGIGKTMSRRRISTAATLLLRSNCWDTTVQAYRFHIVLLVSEELTNARAVGLVERTRLFGNLNAYAYYFAELLVGTPPQAASVIVDTGSALCGFPCVGCSHCGNHLDPLFDMKASSTSRTLPCGPDCTRCDAAGCGYLESYSEGSSISGLWFRDLVMLNGSDADNHPVEASLGCHMDERKLFYTQKVNGIFGLAPHGITGRSNVLKDLFKDKAHVNTAVFAICLAEWGGELSVGGYDSRYAALGSHMQWLPLHHTGYYGVELKSIMFDTHVVGSSEEFKGRTVVDSGTTFTYFPAKVFHALRESIIATCQGSRCGAKPVGNDCWLLPTGSRPAKFAPIFLTFSGGSGQDDISVRWPAQSYLFRRGMRGVDGFEAWCMAFASNGASPETVLGISFFMYKNLVFDTTSSKLGVEDANCPQHHHSAQVGMETFSSNDNPAVEEHLQQGGMRHLGLVLGCVGVVLLLISLGMFACAFLSTEEENDSTDNLL